MGENKYKEEGNFIVTLSKGDGTNVQDTNGYLIFKKLPGDPKIPSVSTLMQGAGQAEVRILTPVEEMFLAKQSALKDAKQHLMKSQKLKQKYLKEEDGNQNAKYKWFRNKVMPWNVESGGEDDKKTRKNTKAEHKKTFSCVFGMFASWFERQSRWKPENRNKAVVIKNMDGSDDCDNKGCVIEAGFASEMNAETPLAPICRNTDPY